MQTLELLESLENLAAQLAREDINFFCEYVMRDERGKPFEQDPIHKVWHAFIDICEKYDKRPVILAPWGCGKCLVGETRVLTPRGMRRMDSLLAGDLVLGWKPSSDGGWDVGFVATTGANLSGYKSCLRISFESGRGLILTQDHRVVTERGEVPAEELSEGDRCLSSLPYLPKEFLEIGEDVAAFLGYWLAEGSTLAGIPCYSKDEGPGAACVKEFCRKRGWGCRKHVRQLQLDEIACWLLKRYGLLDRPRSVPGAIFSAHPDEIAAFLGAYWDEQGEVMLDRLCLSGKRELLEDVQALLGRLGIASIISRTQEGLDPWILSVQDPVRFSRKIRLRHPWKQEILEKVSASFPPFDFEDSLWWDTVERIESVGLRAVYDLDAPGYGRFSANGIFVHNSQQIAIARVLWELGRDPNLRIKLVCNSDGNAKQRVAAIGRYIRESVEYQRVFPHVQPDRDAFWSAHELYITRSGRSVDPSVEAKGIMSTGVGGRADLIVFDDVVDQRNAIEQPALRDKVKEAFRNVWMSRLDVGGKAWYIATSWHTDDLTALLRYGERSREVYWVLSQEVSDSLEHLRMVVSVSDGAEDEVRDSIYAACQDCIVGDKNGLLRIDAA